MMWMVCTACEERGHACATDSGTAFQAGGPAQGKLAPCKQRRLALTTHLHAAGGSLELAVVCLRCLALLQRRTSQHSASGRQQRAPIDSNLGRLLLGPVGGAHRRCSMAAGSGGGAAADHRWPSCTVQRDIRRCEKSLAALLAAAKQACRSLLTAQRLHVSAAPTASLTQSHTSAELRFALIATFGQAHCPALRALPQHSQEVASEAIDGYIRPVAMRLALAAGQQALCRSPGFLPVAPRPTQAPRSCCAPWKAQATNRRQQITESPHRAARMATAAGASGGSAASDAFPRRAGVVRGGVHRKSVAYFPTCLCGSFS